MTEPHITEISSVQRELEEAAYARDQSAVAQIENLRFFPLTVSGGSGTLLRTASGRQMLDFSASWTAASFGHANPRIAEAVARAASEGAGSSVLSAATAETTRLAERLIAITPARYPERAYLGLSGSDANTAAINAARQATGRNGIVSFSGSYHGGFGSSQEISGFGREPGSDNATSQIIEYPLHDSELSNTEASLRAITARGQTAAVIVETIQCDGGVRVPAPGLLPLVRKVCDETETLLILDEVKAGLGRAGELFSFAASGIQPDLVTMGKSLGGGLAVSAAVGPSWVLDSASASALLTLAGSPIAAAAARAVLDLLDPGEMAANAASLEHTARALIGEYRNSARAGAGLITDVRGRGLLLGIELNAAQVAGLAIYRAWELGCVVYVVADNVLELTPPLGINGDELKEGLNIIFSALDDVALDKVPLEVLDRFSGW